MTLLHTHTVQGSMVVTASASTCLSSSFPHLLVCTSTQMWWPCGCAYVCSQPDVRTHIPLCTLVPTICVCNTYVHRCVSVCERICAQAARLCANVCVRRCRYISLCILAAGENRSLCVYAGVCHMHEHRLDMLLVVSHPSRQLPKISLFHPIPASQSCHSPRLWIFFGTSGLCPVILSEQKAVSVI